MNSSKELIFLFHETLKMFICRMYYVNNNLARYLNSWVLFSLKTFFICFSLSRAVKSYTRIILLYTYISLLFVVEIFSSIIFFGYHYSYFASALSTLHFYLIWLIASISLFSFAFKGIISNTSSLIWFSNKSPFCFLISLMHLSVL